MDLWENAVALGWAACAVDGEGCIGANSYVRRTGDHKGKYAWAITVKVSNTDPRFPRKMLEIFGVGSVSRAHRGRTPRERPTYEWQVASRKAEFVLRTILPHLVIKREQAEIALAICDTMHVKGGEQTYTGSKATRKLRPEILATRQALSVQLKVLKRNPPIGEVG